MRDASSLVSSLTSNEPYSKLQVRGVNIVDAGVKDVYRGLRQCAQGQVAGLPCRSRRLRLHNLANPRVHGYLPTHTIPLDRGTRSREDDFAHERGRRIQVLWTQHSK